MTDKIHPAIIAIMRAIGPIAKAQQNTQQRYNFRGIDDVYNACHPHFAEHGVYSTSEVLDAQHTETTTGKGQALVRSVLRMRYTFHAEDGSSVSTEVVGEGIDYGGDKASNKAMSAADKYAILQLLKIPTAMVDSDRDCATPPQTKEAPTAAPRGERVVEDDLRSLYKLWAARNGDDSLSRAERRELFLRDCRECAGDTSLTEDAATWSKGALAKCVKEMGQ